MAENILEGNSRQDTMSRDPDNECLQEMVSSGPNVHRNEMFQVPFCADAFTNNIGSEQIVKRSVNLYLNMKGLVRSTTGCE